MHIGSAHLHGNIGQPPAGASSAAGRAAEATRKRLFAASEELDASATAEGSWMVGAWSGSGGGGQGQRNGEHERPSGRESPDRALAENTASVTAAGMMSELALEQSAMAGIAATGSSSLPVSSFRAAAYGADAAPSRVEKTPEGRQISYWA